ncbi:3-keto-disaccharide hydrolase [Fibrella arboris]|uniref:3-keto-disaccharide hydrolase n=1 Tax=Fibrella arboris TaxID=3242486 RepID=UPI00352050F3
MKKQTLLPLLLAISFVAQGQTTLSTKKWTSLFDGKSLKGWKQVAGTATYAVEEGVIVGRTVAQSPNTFLITDQEYGDFVLELDVKIEDLGSNSGIQFRSQYDPAGRDGKGRVFGYQYELDPSPRKWTGGIYDEGRRDWLYPMGLNPSGQNSYKHNEFNQVRIECVGNQLRTWVNGTPAAYVVDNLDARGVIALQVHAISSADKVGKKIYWKNIRIKGADKPSTDFPKAGYVVNTNPNTLTDFEKQNGWKLLFDGTSPAGWRSATKETFPAQGWTINDGLISVESSKTSSARGGDIISTQQYGAFDLSFDFLLTPGGNSGVKYFATLPDKGGIVGLEFQVLDDKLHPDAKAGRDGNRTMASLYDMIKADKQDRFVHQPGQWNTGRVVVYPNNHVEHYLNGVKVLEYDRGSPAFRELVALSKYKVYPNFGEAPKGHILLQDHGDKVSFRSIKIKELR